MKKLTLLFSMLFLISTIQVWAEESNGAGRGAAGSVSGAKAASRGAVAGTNHISTVSAFKPVVINMNHGSSGGHNRNFPSQQTQPARAPQASQPARQQPSYGQLHWNNQTTNKTQVHTTGVTGVMVGQAFQRPRIQNYSRAGIRASVAVHHHAYVQGYVRKKLQKIGVSAEPNLITDRAEIIHTDRAHSIIKFPAKGPDHMAITASIVSPRHFNDPIVRDHMTIADSPEWQARADRFNVIENQVGHHYWHNDGGITYCHYLDNSGYHWYGWYLGNQYFWTRNFNGRWWWYDADFDRWCFWNNGFWWWQDPYHVADLYCYNNANYIPCNSADDQVVVTSSDNNSNLQSYTSPDGSKVVKVDADTQDAFLYDTANPPAFDPVYLASGVQSVQFSDTSNGRPLEIILKLNDGSFDMFDGEGNAYSPGAFDSDQASQGIPPAGPAYESAPPSNPPTTN